MDEPLSYPGDISIEAIENSGENAAQFGLLTAQSIHYPDCQQLVIWLPQYGRSGYGSYHVRDRATRSTIAEGEIEQILNGSTQILFDTLTWPDGNYVLEIEHCNYCTHQLHFRKQPQPTKSNKPIVPDRSSTPANDGPCKIYLDGVGNPIPNEDEVIRQKMQTQLARAFGVASDDFSPQLQVEGSVRAGNVIYLEGATRIEFWYEMGGGNCKLFIDIPPTDAWKARAQTPLARRDEILTFIANEIKQQKALSWRFEISDREITFY